MNKKVLNEIEQMKFLFGYKPGKVLSEQEMPVMDEDFSEIELEEPETEVEDFSDINFSDVIDSPEVAPAPTREKERTREKEKETEKPFRPQRPDRENLPAYDPHPQGRRRMRDMDENIYEIEIDDDIEELFKK